MNKFILFAFVFVAVFCTSIVNSTPALYSVVTNENYAPLLKKYEFSLIAFYAPWCSYSRTLLPEYEKVARDLTDKQNLFVGAINIDVEKRVGHEERITHVPVIKLFKNGNFVADYAGRRQADNIIAWVNEMMTPIEELTFDRIKLAEVEKKPILVGLYKPERRAEISTHAGYDGYTVNFLNIQKKLNTAAFVQGNAQTLGDAVIKKWGVSGKKFPAFVLITWADTKSDAVVRVYDEDIPLQVDDLLKWTDQCVSGGACPSYQRSEPIPTQTGKLKVLTSKTFEKVVFDTKKDVLVVFHDSEKIDKIYNELAERVHKGSPHLIVASFNTKANFLPPEIVEITASTQVVMFSARDKKNPSIFLANEITIDGLISFTKQQASNKVIVTPPSGHPLAKILNPMLRWLGVFWLHF